MDVSQRLQLHGAEPAHPYCHRSAGEMANPAHAVRQARPP
jgi:hypothetical protein